MTILASLLVGLLFGVAFAWAAEPLVLFVRDAFSLNLDIQIYSIIENTRNLGSVITGVIAAFLSFLLLKKKEKITARGSVITVTIVLFIFGLILTPLLSIFTALCGASVAGVKPGGFGWQYLYALYGGGILGLLGFLGVYFLTLSIRKDAVFSFVATALSVPITLFIISLGFHFLAIRAQ
jgi:hypothetical protein